MITGQLFLACLEKEVGRDRAAYITRELSDLIGPIIRAGDAALSVRLDQLTSDTASRVEAYEYDAGAISVSVKHLSSDRIRSHHRRYRIPHEIILGDHDIHAWRDSYDASREKQE